MYRAGISPARESACDRKHGRAACVGRPIIGLAVFEEAVVEKGPHGRPGPPRLRFAERESGVVSWRAKPPSAGFFAACRVLCNCRIPLRRALRWSN